MKGVDTFNNIIRNHYIHILQGSWSRMVDTSIKYYTYPISREHVRGGSSDRDRTKFIFHRRENF